MFFVKLLYFESIMLPSWNTNVFSHLIMSYHGLLWMLSVIQVYVSCYLQNVTSIFLSFRQTGAIDLLKKGHPWQTAMHLAKWQESSKTNEVNNKLI